MPVSCTAIRTNLASQTPVFDSTFLNDFISDMVNEPFVGRHQTRVWDEGVSTLFYDKVHVEQPNFLSPWQRRTATECGPNACNPPRTFVAFGTTRDSAFMENKVLNSQPFCLDQLRQIPHVGEQIGMIYKVLRKMPISFIGDFLRTRFLSYHDTLQIVDNRFGSFAVTSANTDIGLATINLGSSGALPQSELTLTYLEYMSQLVGMRGYNSESGLMKGMRNLVTHSRTYQKLVGLNPEVKAQLHLVGVKDVSPLYQPGTGINGDPFGSMAPTFDEHQVRFQLVSGGLLNRVLPYLNTPATTGEKPIVNPAWFNARYALSYILHPKAAVLYTPKPKKIHEMIPSVNSAMWGQWDFINPKGVIQWPNPDGTTCTQNNDLQWWFYWLCYLEAGFRYDQRDLVIPMLHLIDGAGKDCAVNSAVCGTAPQYVAQDTDSSPIEC